MEEEDTWEKGSCGQKEEEPYTSADYDVEAWQVCFQEAGYKAPRAGDSAFLEACNRVFGVFGRPPWQVTSEDWRPPTMTRRFVLAFKEMADIVAANTLSAEDEVVELERLIQKRISLCKYLGPNKAVALAYDIESWIRNWRKRSQPSTRYIGSHRESAGDYEPWSATKTLARCATPVNIVGRSDANRRIAQFREIHDRLWRECRMQFSNQGLEMVNQSTNSDFNSAIPLQHLAIDKEQETGPAESRNDVPSLQERELDLLRLAHARSSLGQCHPFTSTIGENAIAAFRHVNQMRSHLSAFRTIHTKIQSLVANVSAFSDEITNRYSTSIAEMKQRLDWDLDTQHTLERRIAEQRMLLSADEIYVNDAMKKAVLRLVLDYFQPDLESSQRRVSASQAQLELTTTEEAEISASLASLKDDLRALDNSVGSVLAGVEEVYARIRNIDTAATVLDSELDQSFACSSVFESSMLEGHDMQDWCLGWQLECCFSHPDAPQSERVQSGTP